MRLHPLSFLTLSVALAVGGCERAPGDPAAARADADEANVIAEAAMLEEMNAVANIQANVTARVAVEEMMRAQEDAVLDNVLLAMPDAPLENAAGNAVDTPRPPASPAPPVARDDLQAADQAVKAAMERRRDGR